CPEFTSLCPKTGQPDFGTITYTYTPAKQCVELKSLKLYLQRFRNQGIFYESAVNRLLDDFVAACQPRRCRVVGSFTPRGVITTLLPYSSRLPVAAHILGSRRRGCTRFCYNKPDSIKFLVTANVRPTHEESRRGDRWPGRTNSTGGRSRRHGGSPAGLLREL